VLESFRADARILSLCSAPQVFARRVESIEHDAHERLKIGTKKGDVSRFFAENRIPFTIVEFEAIGTLQTSGCAPLGCGADSALIGSE
jgi:hypothetical protein